MKLRTWILTVLVLGGLVAACDTPKNNESTYVAVATFEFSDIVDYMVDSLVTTLPNGSFQGADGLTFVCPNPNSALSPTQTGFVLSLRHDPTLAEGHQAKPMAVLSKSGAHGNTYVVYVDKAGAPESHTVYFDYASYGTCTLDGFCVNNTNQVATIATYGMEGIPAFAPGDWLKLTVTGYKGSSKAGTCEVMLADYTDAELNVIKEWTAVPTEDFGTFESLDFTVTSNRTDVPLEVCLDYFQATVSVTY